MLAGDAQPAALYRAKFGSPWPSGLGQVRSSCSRLSKTCAPESQALVCQALELKVVPWRNKRHREINKHS